MKFKLAIRIVAAAVVGALLIGVSVRVDWSGLGQRLIGASPTDLSIMAVAWISAWLLRPVRFRYLLRVLGQVEGADYRTIWTAMVLGAAVNSFTPMRAGDLVLAVFLRQRLGIGMHQSLTVIVADWMCDFVCVVALFAGALAFAPAVAAWTDQAVMLLIGILTLGLVGLWGMLRLRTRIVALLDFSLARLAPRWQIRGRQMAEQFLAGLAIIGAWRSALPLMLISALIWSLIGVSYWFGLRAVFEPASAAAAAFNMSAVALSFVVPLGPGGLGTFEAATVLALAVFEVPLDAALAFAVISHIFQLGSTVLFAALALVTRQLDFQSLRLGAERQR